MDRDEDRCIIFIYEETLNQNSTKNGASPSKVLFQRVNLDLTQKDGLGIQLRNAVVNSMLNCPDWRL